MTSVAIQPQILRYGVNANLPITFLLDAIIMMTAMSGPAIRPFKTADQNSALTGSM